MVGALTRIARFFRDESCGQCVPCRVGTVRQEELLARLARVRRPPTAGATTSWPSSARSARRCATPRSAASARRRARRSRAPCASRSWWRCERRRPEHGPRSGRRDQRAARRRAAGRPAADRHPPPPGGPAEPAAAGAAGPGPGARRAHDRRRGRHRPGRLDDPRRLPRRGHRHADPLLPREPDPGQRLPRLRRRGHRLARPRAGVLAQGRGRDGRQDRLRARPPQPEDGPRVPRLVGRPLDRARPPPGYIERYGADPARYGPPAAPAAAGERDAHEAGHHHPPPVDAAQTVAQPVKVDNDLYVRDYSKCILCYKCVEACGEDAQNTFAIAVAGRGFDARISTE